MRLLKTGFLSLLMAIALTFTSCKSDEIIQPKSSEVDVTFDLENLDGYKADLTKSVSKALNKGYTNKDGEEILYPVCTEDSASYVKVIIDGVSYTVQMTALENQTEVLQLDANDANIIEEFIVYNDSDIEIYQMPEVGSDEVENAGLTGVPFDMDLAGFTKRKIHVDVVCWHDYTHKTLAWQWYEINYHQIKTLCFFGDVCTKFFEDFHEEGSPYYGQSYDGYDFPAIFRILIFNGEELIASESNASYFGSGQALCIEYMDNLLIDEDFRFEIWFTDPVATTLVYKAPFEDGVFSNEDAVDSFGGPDGVFTFAIGNCDSQGNNDVDLILPSYLPLPKTATFKVTGGLYSNGQSYLDLWLKDINGTYAIENTISEALPGFCGAKADNITRGVWYESDVYSSLNPSEMPAKYAGYNWGALNWLINNPQGSAIFKQAAIWALTDGTTANSFSTEALMHSDYRPKVGEYAIVMFDPIEEACKDDIQIFIVRVDP